MNKRHFLETNLVGAIGIASARSASATVVSGISIFITVGLLAASQFAQATEPAHSDQPIVSPADAIARLKEGTGRFTTGNAQHPHESN